MFSLYGKSEDQIRKTLPIFNAILWDYTYDQIKEAFMAWMRTANQFPTPADIVNIIEREGKPGFDKAVYVNLCKKRESRTYLSSDEHRYIDDYENFMRTGQH